MLHIALQTNMGLGEIEAAFEKIGIAPISADTYSRDKDMVYAASFAGTPFETPQGLDGYTTEEIKKHLTENEGVIDGYDYENI